MSKSNDRLYQGSSVDYKDDSGRWRVGKIAKVDDTWKNEGIVVVCAESREMRYFSMRKKACRERIARPGRYTVPKKEDLFWYTGGHEEPLDTPKDMTSHHHDAILGARRNSATKEETAVASSSPPPADATLFETLDEDDLGEELEHVANIKEAPVSDAEGSASEDVVEKPVLEPVSMVDV